MRNDNDCTLTKNIKNIIDISANDKETEKTKSRSLPIRKWSLNLISKIFILSKMYARGII